MEKFQPLPRMLLLVLVVFTAATVTEHAQAQTQSIVYVDGVNGQIVSPSTSNPGNSWSVAYRYLQDGLTRAQQLHDGQNPPANVELWVADGTYRPDQYANPPAACSGGGNRCKSFELKNNVSIYGGFAGPNPGSGEPGTPAGFALRNPAVNIAILSGDLSANDGPAAFQDYGENSYHVVTASSSVQPSTAGPNLDGVTITGGNADGPTEGSFHNGAGLWNNAGAPRIRQCIFVANTSSALGGGVYCQFNSTPMELRNSTFENNQAVQHGGGIAINGKAKIINCLVQECQAGGGTGIAMIKDATLLDIINCRILNNTSNSEPNGSGGAITLNPDVGATASIVNCLIAGNASLDSGGGIYDSLNVQLTVTNSTIANNNAHLFGGGIYVSGSTATLNNCIIWGNMSDNLDPQISGSPVVCYSDVELPNPNDEWPTGSGCTDSNINANPNFVNAAGGNYRLKCPSPAIDTALDSGVPLDSEDVDEGGNPNTTTQKTPDLDLEIRLVNAVDMGSYETDSFTGTCIGDVDGDCDVDVNDLIDLISGWGDCPGCPGDIHPSDGCDSGNDDVDTDDLILLMLSWGSCVCDPSPNDEQSMPQSVSECMDACSLEEVPYSDEWDECVDKCVQALCEAEIIECD